MEINHDSSLSNLSTMHLGGNAAHLVTVSSRMELLDALSWAQTNGNLPIIMVGTGSNIIWRDEGFSGLVIVNRIMRYEVFEEDELSKKFYTGLGFAMDPPEQTGTVINFFGDEEPPVTQFRFTAPSVALLRATIAERMAA